MGMRGNNWGTLADRGEFGLIDDLSALLGAPGGCVEAGIGDDCAVLRVGGRALLFAIDTMVEGAHFLPLGEPPHPLCDLRAAGWRLAVSNLSDIAAMGGRPLGATVSVAAPATYPVSALELVYRGLRDAAQAYSLPVCGGDTVRTEGPVVVSLSILGEADSVPILRRGARPGDVLCVTGALGASRAALALARGEGPLPEPLRLRHLYPTPRLAEGLLLAADAHAMMDLSDGMAGDLPKLAAASDVGFEIDFDSLPVSDDLLAASSSAATARRWALAGGEDYELLVALPAERVEEACLSLADHAGLHPVGRVLGAAEGRWLLRDGARSPWDPSLSWDHYRR